MGEILHLIDGGMGSLLMERGLAEAGRFSDELCVLNPEAIRAIHEEYARAGADVITTATFNASRFHFPGTDGALGVAEIFAAAVKIAREACDAATAEDGKMRLVAGDMGPLGVMLKPLGTLTEDDAYGIFLEEAKAAIDAGADLLLVETMTDLTEARAAVRAAVEVAGAAGKPVWATMSYTARGRTIFGARPEQEAATFAELGVAALGVNCSVGPDAMVAVIKKLAAATDLPIIAQPNAGLPRVEGTKTVYDMGPEEFAGHMGALIEAGASIIGSCCGTTPAYTKALTRYLSAQ